MRVAGSIDSAITDLAITNYKNEPIVVKPFDVSSLASGTNEVIVPGNQRDMTPLGLRTGLRRRKALPNDVKPGACNAAMC